MELSKNNAYPTGLNNTKAECFSTGVTALQLGTGEDIPELYNMKSFKIDTERLEKLKIAFQAKRSPLLGYLVSKMLELDPNNRPYFSEIAALLDPYAVDIESHRDPELNPNVCMESLRSYETTPNSLLSHTLSNFTHDLIVQNTNWVSTANQQQESPAPKPNIIKPNPTFPVGHISSIPRPNPINLMSALQQVIPATNFTQSIYQPATQPPPPATTTTTIVR